MVRSALEAEERHHRYHTQPPGEEVLAQPPDLRGADMVILKAIVADEGSLLAATIISF